MRVCVGVFFDSIIKNRIKNRMEENNKNPNKITKQERKEAARLERQRDHERYEAAEKRKKIAIWLGGFAFLVLVLGFLVWAVSQEKTDQGDSSGAVEFSLALNEDDNTYGPPDAEVTLVEFGDFECPACRSAFPVIDELKEDYGDEVQFVYRHFPLSFHKNAELAARASEAAAKQGKFWEMHDMLFEKQSDWADSSKAESIFLDYAREIGLDIDKYKEDIKSDAVKQKVQRDIASAGTQVTGTPTFFLDGEKVQNYSSLRMLIDSFLDEQSRAETNDAPEIGNIVDDANVNIQVRGEKLEIGVRANANTTGGN